MSGNETHTAEPMTRRSLAGLLVALALLLAGFGIAATGNMETGGIVILVGAVIGIAFKATRF